MSQEEIYEQMELYCIEPQEIENGFNLPRGYIKVVERHNEPYITGIALDSLALAVSSIVEKREQQHKAPSTQETTSKAKGMLLHYDLHPLFKALFKYAINGVSISSSDSLVKLGFEMIKPKIDKHEQKKRRALRDGKKGKI